MANVRRAIKKSEVSPAVPPWTFLTNHAHVLICVAEDPNARIRDIADRVGITERAVQRIISELEGGNYLTHVRDGRRSVYRVKPNQPLRHPVEGHSTVATLLKLVAGAKPGKGRRAAEPREFG